MNEAPTLCSPLSVFPTKQKIPEKPQCPHLITYLSKNQLRIFRGFSFLQVMITYTRLCAHFNSPSLKKSKKRTPDIEDFNFILFLTPASAFKSAHVLWHESVNYVLCYIKMPKSGVKLQSAKFQTSSGSGAVKSCFSAHNGVLCTKASQVESH